LLDGDAELLREFGLGLVVMRHELVQGRVEEADRGGQAVEGLEDAGEVLALVGQELGEGLLRGPRALSARIISRTASMRSPSKNMCSVRVRPMPWAPKAMAWAVCSGLSALVRTARRVACEHHFISWT
jgi:hypothetical protein